MLLPSSLTFYTSRWMQLTLLGWMVLEKTDSALLVAMVGFALMAPLLVFGLVGGVVADSPRRMTVIRALQGFNLAAVVALGIVFAFDSVAAWTAYPVVITTGVAWAFDQPFKRRVVRDLLGVAGVTNGIALESVVMTASRLIGPAIAGLLIATVGVRLGYFAVVGLAVASYVLIWLVNIPPPSGVEKRTEGTKRLTSVFEGLSYVKSDRLLLGTVVVTIAVNLFIFPYLQVILVVARDVIEVEAGLGLLLSAEGLGSLAAAMTIASFAGRAGRLGVLYMVGSTVAAAGLLLLSFQTGYVGALLSLLLMGFGLAGFSTMQAAIVVVNSADQMRGKALGVVTLAIGAGPLGALIVGAVANSFGPQLALRIDALAALASLAALGILVPEFRARMGTRRLGDSQAALVDPPSRATV